MATAQSEQPVKPLLHSDPYTMCRLCFQSPGIHDVSVAPVYLQAIKKLHNINVSVCVRKRARPRAFHCSSPFEIRSSNIENDQNVRFIPMQIYPTDQYTKSVCEQCFSYIEVFALHQETVKAGQYIFSKRIEMFEQVNLFMRFVLANSLCFLSHSPPFPPSSWFFYFNFASLLSRLCCPLCA